MSYEKMSNYEINLAVAKHQLRGQFIEYLPQGLIMNGVPEFGPVNYVEIVTSSGSKQSLDFCSNPEQYTVLQHKEKISVSWWGDYWSIHSPFDCAAVIEKVDSAHKIGKAICIVYLKMMEAKNEH